MTHYTFYEQVNQIGRTREGDFGGEECNTEVTLSSSGSKLRSPWCYIGLPPAHYPANECCIIRYIRKILIHVFCLPCRTFPVSARVRSTHTCPGRAPGSRTRHNKPRSADLEQHLSHLQKCNSCHFLTSPRNREVFPYRYWQILGSEPHPPCSPCWRWWREHRSASSLFDGVWHCGDRGGVATVGRSVFTRCLATSTPRPSPGSKRAATRVSATQLHESSAHKTCSDKEKIFHDEFLFRPVKVTRGGEWLET